MPAHTRCQFCDDPGTLAGAKDQEKVPCNVRRFRDHFFTMWRCTGCGSLHCAEDADLAAYYAHYPLKQQKIGYTERVGYANRLRLMRRQGLHDTDQILDYGCGSGLFVGWLRGKGLKRVFGYDAFVPEYQDPETLRQSYDAVVSYDVIEHDDDPRAFLQRVSQLVRAGGLLVIGTPNADHVSLQRKGDPSLHPPYHRHVLSKRVLLSLGSALGLKPVHIYDRSFYDSLIPTVNSRFLWSYVAKTGLLDTAVEPPRTSLVLRSPDLLFLAFFGFFVPAGDYIIVSFRKS